MQDSFFQKINSFSGNTSVVWLLVCLTEALMIKALIITNFKQFSGINDSFFSRFACLINIGFSLGSHIALFFLGNLGSDDILTGIKGKPRQMSLYYEITIGTLSVVSCFSLIAIGIKRFKAYQKDKELIQDVNVMITITENNDVRRSINLGEHNGIILSIPLPTLAMNEWNRAQSAPPFLPTLDRQPKQKFNNERYDNVLINNTVSIVDGTLDSQPKQKLNNIRYNKPVINTVVLASSIFLIAGSLLIYIVVFNVNESTSDYIKSVWFGWAGSIFFRTLLPIWIITFHHTDFRTFIFKTLHNMWSNVCLQNNRVQPILNT